MSVHAVVLLRPGGVPKTSSGKVQRRACRAAYLADELPVVARSVLSPSAAGEESTEPPPEPWELSSRDAPPRSSTCCAPRRLAPSRCPARGSIPASR